MTSKSKLKLNSLNVRGLNNTKKRKTMFQWLNKTYKGITMLQETHSTIRSEEEWRKQWGKHIEFSHGTHNCKGVAILFDNEHEYEILNMEKDDDGRFLLVNVVTEDQNFILVNIYAPTKDNIDAQLLFFEYIADKLNAYADKNIVIGGDFNVCLNPKLDKKGGKQEKQSKSALSIISLLENFNLTDVWRVLNEDKTRFTWRGFTKKGHVSSRLDYWLISTHMLYDLEETDILPSIKSDHSLIRIIFELKDGIERGRGFWKFNHSLLKDPLFVERVKAFLHNCSEKYKVIENKALVWDALKCEIRGIAISYSAFKNKKNRKYIEELKQELVILEIGLDNNEEVMERYNAVKLELERNEDEILKGSMVRSRAQWIEDGEKCSKYFFQLEKRNYKTKCIRTLFKEEQRIYEPKQILDECQSFYANLYTEKNTDERTHSTLFHKTHPMLSENEKRICESKITMKECFNSINELPNNKSPGSDGMSTEFYKFFWDDIKVFLLESFDYSFENNLLSLDQRRAVLTLIPKTGKDIRYLKNWRPISLLNTDYKILAKILANRIQKVMSCIVNNDQAGYIKGRNIGDNIRTMLDILEITNEKTDAGLMVLIDFEKAFDTISWSFLYETLMFFNFGNTFIKYIKLLYSKPLCCVSNNGYHSEFFQNTRGIRQGCPISALLFLLCVEVLAINIRENKEIKGIILGNTEIKITQFADDTCLYLNGTSSLENVFKVFEDFYRYAGLRLNKDKTEMIWLGKNNRTGKCLDINITNKPTKVLGLWLSKNTEEIIKINIDERITKLKSLLNMWKQRNLTLKGKITVLRSQALPLVLFAGTFLYMSDIIIEEVEQILYSFVWPKGKHHVKKMTLIESIPNGGLKMPDLYSMLKAIKLTSIRRLITSTSSCSVTAKHILKTDNLATFFKCKNNTVFLPKMPQYYKQLLDMWYSVYNNVPTSINEVMNEIIWNNAAILRDNKPIQNKQWEGKGIILIQDLFNDNMDFMSKLQIETVYNVKCNFIFLNGIKSAIPKKWLQIIKNTDLHVMKTIKAEKQQKTLISIKINKKYVNIDKVKCRHLYWSEIESIGQRPTSYYKWESEYYYATLDWEHINQIPYVCARETSLQSLQYQIIHRFYPCRYMLNIWKLEPDNKCKLCSEIDSIQHYFFDCKYVSLFWNCVKTWFKYNFDFVIKFGPLDILLGIPNYDDNLEINILNFVILYGKYYIKACKNKEKPIEFYEYQVQLKERMLIEERIHFLNHKEIVFQNKWCKLLDSL